MMRARRMVLPSRTSRVASDAGRPAARSAGEVAEPSTRHTARVRLRGTVWEHSRLAHAGYRSALGVGNALADLGVSADFLTLGSVALAAAGGVAASYALFSAAALSVLASGACDLFDGIVARRRSQSSPFGALLDSTSDRLSDALPLLGLVALYADHGPIAALPAGAMVAAFAVSYVRARAEALGIGLPPLAMRRPERLLFVVLALLLGNVHVPGVPLPAPVTLGLIALMGLLSLWGAVAALAAARRRSKQGS